MKLSVKIAGIFAVVAFALTAVSANAAFTRDLTLGSTGADVTELQTVLETNGYLTIPTGVSKGYFGAMTQSALAKWQAKVGISPAAGYFGPISRAKLAEMPADDSDDSDDSSDLSGGEASLEKFEISSEDDAEEGKMTHVATVEFDVEDADIQIDRMDLEFVFTGNNPSGSADSDPWEVFETITLMVDGDEVAEVEVDDEDEWLRDDSPFVFRLSELDLEVAEGETAEVEVYLTAMNNVDDVTNASWTIAVDDDGIRGTDGEGIQQYIGDDSDTVAINLDAEGGDEDITIKSSSSDPDQTTLLVDESDDSEWHEAFIFKLEAEENDITVDQLVLNASLDLNSTSTLNKVVSDMYIEIDGEQFDDYTIATGTATSSNLTFDIDNEFTIDADEEVEVVVFVEFKQQDPNYQDGTTFQLVTVSVNGEGADDVSDASVASGAAHTLSLSAAEITNVSWTTSESANGATGIIDLFFTVTAEEEDFLVLGADVMDTLSGTASTTSGAATTTSGFGQVSRVSGDSVTSVSGGFRVNEGDTTRFRVRYEKRSVGSLEVTVDSVAGQELADDEQLSPTIVLE